MPDPLHAIRLRGAWAVTREGTRFRYTRPFGWPAALDPHERVWLVVVGTASADVIAVNGTPVGHETDITPLLRPRNEFAITRDTNDSPGEVTLEVRLVDSAGG